MVPTATGLVLPRPADLAVRAACCGTDRLGQSDPRFQFEFKTTRLNLKTSHFLPFELKKSKKKI
jgi:hypothetical protein